MPRKHQGGNPGFVACPNYGLLPLMPFDATAQIKAAIP